jgi:glycerophosphoryl diester phosphodiesterase
LDYRDRPPRAWGDHPENSLEAFEEAVRIGADMIELDVRRTSDGLLVASHDPVVRLRHEEVTAKSGSSRPPLLEDVLRAMTGRVALNLELKERGCVAEVLARLARLGVEDCLITSFLGDVVREVKAFAPQHRTGLVIGGALAEGAVVRARRSGADCLALEATVAGAVTAEIPCLVWTVNEPAAIDRCPGERAIVGMITDRPVLALERRAVLSGRTAPATPS